MKFFKTTTFRCVNCVCVSNIILLARQWILYVDMDILYVLHNGNLFISLLADARKIVCCCCFLVMPCQTRNVQIVFRNGCVATYLSQHFVSQNFLAPKQGHLFTAQQTQNDCLLLYYNKIYYFKFPTN